MNVARTLFWLSLVGCAGDVGKDALDPTDATDGDVTDTPTDSDEATDAQADPATTWDHAVDVMAVARARDGLDLDGDGEGDNALGAFALVINPLLEATLDGATGALILQVQADDLSAATSGALSMFPGSPGEGGAWSVSAALVDADGVARVSTEVELAAGAYSGAWLDQSITFGERTLQTATPVLVQATATATSHDGVLGFGVSVDALTAFLSASGNEDLATSLAAVADLDTDADGTNDAVSAAFTFEASACVIEPGETAAP
jgi:hypothetical protein